MREIIIVISDLYLAGSDSGDASRSSAATPPPRGLQEALRFGQRSPLEGNGGWRAYLARSMRRDDLALASPAAVAAATAATGAAISSTGVAPAAGTAGHAIAPSADRTALSVTAGTVWIATPIHLLAGLTSLHLDHRGLLTLSPEDQAALAHDFTATFGDSDFHLAPSPSGALLLQSRATVNATATEPTRALANDLEASLPSGPHAPALKRLGAEMEMWLHSHPLNEARARRGELPISTLWLWGGGPLLRNPPTSATQPAAWTAFGSDPYLIGLSRLSVTPVHPLPERLPDAPRSPDIQSVAIVAEVIPLLHANPRWTMFEALADIDRRFIEPAITTLRRGTVDNVVLIANDTRVQLRRRDLWKFWRPHPKSVAAALRALCW